MFRYLIIDRDHITDTRTRRMSRVLDRGWSDTVAIVDRQKLEFWLCLVSVIGAAAGFFVGRVLP